MVAENIPDDDETSIVHGDYRLDNMIMKNQEVIGVLDWELSTLGHPLQIFVITVLPGEQSHSFMIMQN